LMLLGLQRNQLVGLPHLGELRGNHQTVNTSLFQYNKILVLVTPLLTYLIIIGSISFALGIRLGMINIRSAAFSK